VLRRLFGHLPCDFPCDVGPCGGDGQVLLQQLPRIEDHLRQRTARLCDALGVDPFEVMDLVCRDTQLNISKAYLKPGFAFGGSCLPKDLRATMYLAKQKDVDLPMHAGILASNREHIDLAIRKVAASGKRRIGMIGLAFKTGTDDLRESPLVLLAEYLIGKGMSLLVHDPDVHLSSLLGANRRYIEQHLPHIGALIRADLEAVVAESDMLVVGTSDKKTIEQLKKLLRPDTVVLDLANIGERDGLSAGYVGLTWR
jgi:GDP-mannose 6-dehydrogenase